MWLRGPIAFLLACAVAFGLFYLMQSLIALDRVELSDYQAVRVIDFVRLKHESSLEEKKRELPQKQAKVEQPPQPTMATPSLGAAGGAAQQVMKLEAPQPVFEQRAVRLAGGPHLGKAPSDAEEIPMVRINPIFPREAAEKRIEGWVLLEFDISVKGTVKNARVISAQPVGVFDRAALQAIRRWKYKPKIENGAPVERRGIQVRLTFKLDEM